MEAPQDAADPALVVRDRLDRLPGLGDAGREERVEVEAARDDDPEQEIRDRAEVVERIVRFAEGVVEDALDVHEQPLAAALELPQHPAGRAGSGEGKNPAAAEVRAPPPGGEYAGMSTMLPAPPRSRYDLDQAPPEVRIARRAASREARSGGAAMRLRAALPPPFAREVMHDRAEHGQPGEDLDEERVVEPILSGERVVHGAQHAHALEQPGAVLHRDRRAGRYRAQRPDQQPRVERIAIDLPRDAAVRIDQRDLRDVVEPARARLVDEAERPCQRLDAARVRREDLPLRPIDPVLLRELPHRRRVVEGQVEADGDDVERVLAECAVRFLHGLAEKARRRRAHLAAPRIDEAHQQRLAAEIGHAHAVAAAVGEAVVAGGATDCRLAFLHRRVEVERCRRGGETEHASERTQRAPQRGERIARRRRQRWALRLSAEASHRRSPRSAAA